MRQDDLMFCQEVAKRSNSNFLLTFNLLHGKRQSAMYAFYTYCRQIDDVADATELSVDEKRHRLNEWEAEIERWYEGQATHPAGRILQEIIPPFDIQFDHLKAILDGVRMDLTTNRYDSFDQLYTYCFGVASAVGMVCTRIFGCQSDAAYTYAESLGLALQLTNITRDVATDIEIDRIYIPQDELNRYGVTEMQLKNGEYNDAFVALMRFQHDRAADYYVKATASIPPAEKQLLLPARLMAQYYRSILRRIEKKNFDVFRQRVNLPKSYKVAMLLRYWPQLWAAKWQKVPS